MTEDELMQGYRGVADTRDATEDELLIAITDALTLCGWRWMHLRRSDLAIVQGSQGWPDLIALHPTRGLAMALELKSRTGQATGDQLEWLRLLNAAGIPARLVRPADLDLMLEVIVGKRRGLDLEREPAGAEVDRAPARPLER